MNVPHTDLYSFMAQHPMTEADVKWHFNPELEERLRIHAAIDFAMAQEVQAIVAARYPELNLVEKLPFMSIKEDSRAPATWPDRHPDDRRGQCRPHPPILSPMKPTEKPHPSKQNADRLKSGMDVLIAEDSGRVTRTTTRSAPWQLGNGVWVVLLTDRVGGYDCSRVVPA